MPDNTLHYINLGASIVALIMAANMTLWSGGFLSGAIFINRFRRIGSVSVVLFGLSLIASALAYQWFSNAMGW